MLICLKELPITDHSQLIIITSTWPRRLVQMDWSNERPFFFEKNHASIFTKTTLLVRHTSTFKLCHKTCQSFAKLSDHWEHLIWKRVTWPLSPRKQLFQRPNNESRFFGFSQQQWESKAPGTPESTRRCHKTALVKSSPLNLEPTSWAVKGDLVELNYPDGVSLTRARARLSASSKLMAPDFVWQELHVK